ncbi:MAG: uracil phosphoribosyltransferase [Thermoprotei archaeon]|nr:MAG: uracil phosphoribosyltransferase [Thermoprotei archaeon]
MVNEQVHVIDLPYAHHVLTKLRDKNTKRKEFRKYLTELGRIVGMEMSRVLDYKIVEVETPLNVYAKGIELTDMEKVLLIGILRAAIPFLNGILEVIPSARLGLISARRIEESNRGGKDFDVEVSYVKIPEIDSDTTVIIADPMFATGSTMLRIIPEIAKKGIPKKMIIASVIATRYAVNRLLEKYPKIYVFTVSIDKELNSKGFIVPGLGDAGDRAFDC